MCKEEVAFCQLGTMLKNQVAVPVHELNLNRDISGLVSILKAAGLVEYDEKTKTIYPYPELNKLSEKKLVRLRKLMKNHPNYPKHKGQRLVDFVQTREVKKLYREVNLDPYVLIDRALKSAKKFNGPKKSYKRNIKSRKPNREQWIQVHAHQL